MEMRSLAESRELLGAAADGMTDAEVLALRDACYAAARVFLRAYRTSRQRASAKAPAPQAGQGRRS